MTAEKKANIKFRLSDLGVKVGELAIEYIESLEKENAELRGRITDLCKPRLYDGYSLQKENAELKEKIESLANINIKAQNIIAELKEHNKDLCESLDIMNNRESDLLEQIEKMKCCQNCKNLMHNEAGVEWCHKSGIYFDFFECDIRTDWELAE